MTNDKRSTARYVAEIMDISFGAMHAVPNENLGVRKVSARLVTRTLNANQKRA